MERLTNKIGIFTNVIDCENLMCREVCNLHSCDECPIQRVFDKLGKYEDSEEQGILLKKETAVDKAYLYDWYIHSVCGGEPVWTESHIEELFNDFILIPKVEVEAALAEMGCE